MARIDRILLEELGKLPPKPPDTAPQKEKKRYSEEVSRLAALAFAKVDVTWATEESGLLLAISIKSINFRDRNTKNFQKNLVNRRGDALIEAVTLHRRFPYAVLAGFFFLDQEAEKDATARRRSTFQNAHSRFRLFTGRTDPAGRDEQFERMWLLLLDANARRSRLRTCSVGDVENEIPLESVFADLIGLVAERNSDFYECVDGEPRKASG